MRHIRVAPMHETMTNAGCLLMNQEFTMYISITSLDYRRKTQEISLLKPAPEEIVSQTLPRNNKDKRERSKTTAFG